MKLKDILEVENCPHCGSSFGYYTKSFVSGWVNDNKLFETGIDGNRQSYNSGMFDSLNSGKRNRICYCIECDKPIGKDNSE
jgi:hypothetical protein